MKFTRYTLLGFFILLGISLISSCSEVETVAEDDYKSMDSLQIARQMEIIKGRIQGDRLDVENGTHFKKIADMAYTLKDYNQAGMYYMWALQAAPEMDERKTTIHTLIEIAEKYMDNKSIADMFKLAFVEEYPDEPQVNSYKRSISAVDSLNNLLKILKKSQGKSDRGINDPVTAKIVDGVEIYATVMPFKEDAAGKILEGVLMVMENNPRRAFLFIDWLTTKYPSSEEAMNAAFLKGFIYENILGDLTKARVSYQEYIDAYPEHEFAVQAQILLENLGKNKLPF